VALSDFTVSDMDSEIGVDPLWTALTSAQKLGIYNSITQEIANLYRLKSKPDYKSDNLAGVPGGFVVGIPQSSFIVNALAAGSAVVFLLPYTHTRLTDGDYAWNVHAFAANGQEIGVSVVKSPTGMIVKPDFDCPLVLWETIPFSQ
jgi:hypothetical protein